MRTILNMRNAIAPDGKKNGRPYGRKDSRSYARLGLSSGEATSMISLSRLRQSISAFLDSISNTSMVCFCFFDHGVFRFIKCNVSLEMLY